VTGQRLRHKAQVASAGTAKLRTRRQFEASSHFDSFFFGVLRGAYWAIHWVTSFRFPKHKRFAGHIQRDRPC
jgi:hypothetical protein